MFQALQKVYKGKKVFVTGHTGFKGAWLIKILSMLGAEVLGYALAPDNEFDLYNLIKGDTLCSSVIGDLRNKELLKLAIVGFEPDFIFHLAAQPLVRFSYEVPLETFEVNALGTANLLDVLRSLSNKCSVILITTDKVYSNKEWIYPYRESDRLGGYDPYSASKACAEMIIDSYRNSFFSLKDLHIHQKSIAVARAGNVIGGGDWSKDRLLPDIARALGGQENIIVRNPGSVRPWQHVLEPLSGYLLLGSKLSESPVNFSGAYNFGPYVTDTLTVEEMVHLAIEKWGSGNYEVSANLNQPHEASLLKLDISKAGVEIGWTPRLDAKEAVDITMGWYKAFFADRTKVDGITGDQVRSFFMKPVGNE